MISLFRILRYGVQGFRRNIWLSVIAIITMTLTLITITIFGLGDLVARNEYQRFNQRIDYSIYLRDEASDADVQSFDAQLKQRYEVADSTYYDKAAVRTKFDERFGKVDGLKDIVTDDNNPLPREIDVRFRDPKDISSFDNFVQQAQYKQIVQTTSYQDNSTEIDTYLHSTNVLRIFGLFFTGFFILIAVLVILNTIRLAIFARREEIEVMRLVGATSGYIRGPFLVEGLLFGLLGALISAIMFWALLHQAQLILQDSLRLGTASYLSDLLSASFGTITSTTGFDSLFLLLLGMQVIIGVLLGVGCSFVAARRYLHE